MTGAPSLAGCLHSLRAVIFDTDGVIIDSATVHAAAWKGAFDACLAAVGGQRPFDPVDDYLRHVDGRAREDGAAAFLHSRGLDLPLGDPDDAPGTATVRAVAARKEELFSESLRDHPSSPGRAPCVCWRRCGTTGYRLPPSRPRAMRPSCCPRPGCARSSRPWWTATR